MPIYEYRCRDCASEFELIILKGSPPPACPSCESADIEQLLSGFAVSSAGIRESNLQAARKKMTSSATLKDQRVADADYARKEREEHGAPPEKGK
jgi:putative FmdB family regulatory protein